MNIEEVRKFITENIESEEVKTLIGDISKVTPEQQEQIINAFRKSPEYKRELNTEGDRRATGAVEKFRSETLPKHVDEEIKKRFPDITPEQKALREVQAELEAMRQKEKRSELKDLAFKTSAEMGLSQKQVAWLLKYGNLDNEETILSAANDFKEFYSGDVLKEVDERIKTSGSNPPKVSNSLIGKGNIDYNTFKAMTPENRVKAIAEKKVDLNQLVEQKNK